MISSTYSGSNLTGISGKMHYPLHQFGIGKDARAVFATEEILAISNGTHIRFLNVATKKEWNLEGLNLDFQTREKITTIAALKEHHILAVAINERTRVVLFRVENAQATLWKILEFEDDHSDVVSISFSRDASKIALSFGVPLPRVEHRTLDPPSEDEVDVFHYNALHGDSYVSINPYNANIWAILSPTEVILFQIHFLFDEHIFKKRIIPISISLESFTWLDASSFASNADEGIKSFSFQDGDRLLSPCRYSTIFSSKRNLFCYSRNDNCLKCFDRESMDFVFVHNFSNPIDYFYPLANKFATVDSVGSVDVHHITSVSSTAGSSEAMKSVFQAIWSFWTPDFPHHMQNFYSLGCFGCEKKSESPEIKPVQTENARTYFRDDATTLCSLCSMNSYLVLAGGRLYQLLMDGKVQAFETDSITALEVIHFNQSPELLVLGFSTGVVALAHINGDKLSFIFCNKLHESRVQTIVVDDKCRYVATLSTDKVIWFTDVRKLKPLSHMEIHTMPHCFSFSQAHQPDQHDSRKSKDFLHLVVSMEHGEVMIYDIDVKRPSRTQHWPVDDNFSWIDVKSVPRAPHLLLVINDAEQLKIATLENDGCLYSEERNQWRDHLKHINALTVDGGCILTGGMDGIVQIRVLRQVQEVAARIHAHGSGVSKIAIIVNESDGSGTLLTSGVDGAVTLWKLPVSGVEVPRRRRCTVKEPAAEVELNHATQDYITEYRSQKKHARAERSAKDRKQIETEIQTLKEKYAQICKDNVDLEGNMLLTGEDLTVDLVEMQALEEEIHRAAEKTKDEIKWVNMANQLLRTRIKDECYSTKKQSDLPYAVSGFHNQIKIASHAVLDTEHDLSLKRALLLADINQEEESRLMQNTYSSYSPLGSDDNASEEESVDDLANLEVYDPISSATRFRSRVNMLNLAKRARSQKLEFNGMLKKMFEKKKNLMQRVQEMSDEIATIEEELKIESDSSKRDLKAFEDEKPDAYLTIESHEILRDEVVNANLTKPSEVKHSQEDAGGDSARALKNMMGGTLDTRTEVQRLADVVESMHQQYFDEMKEEDMIESERVEFQAYQKKLEELQKARNIRNRMLTNQLKKLNNEINDAMKSFDTKLALLSKDKLSWDMKIRLSELMILQVVQEDVEKDSIVRETKEIRRRIEEVSEQEKEANATFVNYTCAFENRGKILENLYADDRNIVKTFKKALHGHQEHLEDLVKFYKSKKALGEKPEDLPKALWDKMKEFRRQRIAKESQIAEEVSLQRTWTAELNKVESVRDGLRDEVSAEQARLASLQKRQQELAIDHSFLVNLKCGQVEIHNEKNLRTFRDMIVLDKSIIQNLNSSIRHAGRKKLDTLEEIKIFRRKMNKLKWEVARQELELKFTLAKISEYQTRRVSKQDQVVIRAGGIESKMQTDMHQLERKIKYNKKNSQAKLEKKRKQYELLQARLLKYKQENAKLDRKLSKVQRLHNEQNEIRSIRTIRATYTFHRSYSRLIGNDVMRKEQFLSECTKAMNPVQCTNVFSEGDAIVIAMQADQSEFAAKSEILHSKGLFLPSFGDLGCS